MLIFSGKRQHGSNNMARALYHKLWQTLPQPWRRALLFKVTGVLAPRPAPVAPSGYPEPIIVAGFLTATTGLGEWARLAYRAFAEAGHDVRGIDLGAAMMQGSEVRDFSWRDGRNAYGAGTIMLHVNAPYVPLAMRLLGRKLVQSKKIVGCWAWELPDIPPDWQQGFQYIHEIWGLSSFTADAIRRHTNLPVKATPLPVPPPTLPSQDTWVWRKPLERFTVLTMFNMASGFTRKNPLGAIAAFKQAFGDDPQCHLLLKIVHPEAYPDGMRKLQDAARGAKNIEFLTTSLPSTQNAALIAECDVVMSLHRAEGFGLVPAEAMLQSKPVIATGWSGNLDFMNTDNACLISYELVPAHDPQTTYNRHDQLWAEPNIAEAASSLRHLRDNPAFGYALGQRAKASITRQLSSTAYASHLKKA